MKKGAVCVGAAASTPTPDGQELPISPVHMSVWELRLLLLAAPFGEMPVFS